VRGLGENLHEMLLEIIKREKEVNELTKINPSLYRDVANFLKGLATRNHSNSRTIQAKMSEAKKALTFSLVDLLLKIRIQKIVRGLLNGQSAESITSLLTDEEKFVAEPLFEYVKRLKRVELAMINGQPASLKRMSRQLSSKYIVVRCKRDAPPITGSDLTSYGPFKQEDIVMLPRENSEALIALGIVEPVEIEA
jgi:DNA replication initiation complex subunit (GINS family)